MELCFPSIAERFVSGGESSCRRRQLSSKISGLWIALNIIDTITCPLGLPSPLEGLGLVVNPDARGAGTRVLLGLRASASRRRALRGAAQGGADVVFRFPLLAPEARCGALRTLVLVDLSLAGVDQRAGLTGAVAFSSKKHGTRSPPWAYHGALSQRLVGRKRRCTTGLWYHAPSMGKAPKKRHFKAPCGFFGENIFTNLLLKLHQTRYLRQFERL